MPTLNDSAWLRASPLRFHLGAHEVATVYELGWHRLSNGRLIQAAEEAGYALLVTTDQNLKYQQNLVLRKIALLVLRTTSWPRIQKALPAIGAAVERAGVGSYEEVEIP